MIILQAKQDISSRTIASWEKDLTEEYGEKVIIIPHYFQFVEKTKENDKE